MSAALSFIFIFVLWLYIVFIMKSLNLSFYKFLTGTIGLFTICMIFFMTYIEKFLNICIMDFMILIKSVIPIYDVFKGNSIITINTLKGIIAVSINYECSAVIEMLVFTSLAAFFPFGTIARRIMTVLLGNIYIFAANIIRLIFIILITKGFGADYFYIAHTIFARILFFLFTIVLYYYAFTSSHLKFQNVGDIR